MKHNQDYFAGIWRRASEKLDRKKWLILLPICVVGLAAVVLEHPRAESPSAQGNRVVDFVKSQYLLLAEGRYKELSRNVVEGRWTGLSKNYAFDGLVPKGAFETQLEDDLGAGAWRLHFVTLKPVGYSMVDRPAFATLLKRESEILDGIDPSQSIENVFVVTMSGHNTGRCSIVEWERPVPVVRLKGTYTMILRGAPEVYSLVHNEEWFLPTTF
jgi:hypothetical protein